MGDVRDRFKVDDVAGRIPDRFNEHAAVSSINAPIAAAESSAEKRTSIPSVESTCAK